MSWIGELDGVGEGVCVCPISRVAQCPGFFRNSRTFHRLVLSVCCGCANIRAGHALPSAPLFETYDRHQFEHINKILATNLPFDVQLV